MGSYYAWITKIHSITVEVILQLMIKKMKRGITAVPLSGYLVLHIRQSAVSMVLSATKDDWKISIGPNC